jgi:hypothetical protein
MHNTAVNHRKFILCWLHHRVCTSLLHGVGQARAVRRGVEALVLAEAVSETNPSTELYREVKLVTSLDA